MNESVSQCLHFRGTFTETEFGSHHCRERWGRPFGTELEGCAPVQLAGEGEPTLEGGLTSSNVTKAFKLEQIFIERL